MWNFAEEQVRQGKHTHATWKGWHAAYNSHNNQAQSFDKAEGRYKAKGLQKFEATSVMGPLMAECRGGGCASDETKTELYNAIRRLARDFAEDSTFGMGGMHDEALELEKSFCDEMRVMLEADRNQKGELCPYISSCTQHYGRSKDHEDLCGPTKLWVVH